MSSSNRSLRDLVLQCIQRGDARDWEALVAHLQPLVSVVIIRSASRWGETRREQVEDLTQEAFFKICRDRCAILRQLQEKPEAAIVAFIKITVSNLVHDHFRSARSGKRHPAAGLLSTESLDQWAGETKTVDRLQRELLLSEIDKIVTHKLRGATASRDRAIFWLYHRQGMTAKAISSIPAIGLSDKGVESTLYRMNALVKEEMLAAKGISAADTY